MGSTIHIKTKVLPGKKIQISSGSLVEGQPVDVFVVTSAPSHRRHRSVLKMLKSGAPPGIFTTVDEVDDRIREERDSWDR